MTFLFREMSHGIWSTLENGNNNNALVVNNTRFGIGKAGPSDVIVSHL